jgi:hypothetical protein
MRNKKSGADSRNLAKIMLEIPCKNLLQTVKNIPTETEIYSPKSYEDF